MIRRKYKLTDLLTVFKNNKIKNIENIDFAVLDNKGNLSLFYKYDYDNMKKPVLLVLNGEIEYRSLKEIGKNIKWLYLVLEEKELRLEEIFYAFYLENSFYVIKK